MARISLISRKYPTYRDINIKTIHSWFAGKRIDDNAEGFWRVHDNLYDLSSFVKNHPGGSFWLEQTKGTDITEAFETHHISTYPEKLLESFKVRAAIEPRNITLTFAKNGFYKTLKDRVRAEMPKIDRTPIQRNDLIHTILLIATIITSIVSVHLQSKLVMMIAGILLAWTVIASHNYFHQRDNWRMYCFNLSLMSFKDWRVSHALSHHLYPNSYHDLEMSMFEPFFCWVPNSAMKNFVQRYVSWLYSPIVYAVLYPAHLLIRVLYSIIYRNILAIDDLIGFTLPLIMYGFSDSLLANVIKCWLIILISSSFMYSVIGLHAGHHLPQNFHDCDYMKNGQDWGIFQLDTVADRNDLSHSQFMTLTHFGNHALHHLFPAFDHAILPQLEPILRQTLAEFDCGELKGCDFVHQVIGQYKQLARIKPRSTLERNRKN